MGLRDVCHVVQSGHLATTSSLAGIWLDKWGGPRGRSVWGESSMRQDLSQIYERYH